MILMNSDRRLGFTLVELLLVIAIIGILSVIGTTTFSSAIVKGKDSSRKNDISNIAKALEAFNNDFGEYPDEDTGKMVACVDGADPTLIPCPGVDGKFRAKKNGEDVVYLENFPQDPDPNRAYTYEMTGANEGFAIYAALENTQDRDVKKLNGVADPGGWGVNCGTSICNYKVTSSGLVTE